MSTPAKTAKRAPAKRAPAKATPADAASEPEQTPFVGLLVPVIENPEHEGFTIPEVVAVGGIRVTEIETLLKMALRSFRAQHGLVE